MDVAIPKISVVVPIHGNVGNLPRLVAALNAQTLKPHEIIIVDSGDRPIENLPAGTRLIKNPVDICVNWDYNLGARHATGDYILIMQQDCVLEDPRALDKIVL